MQNSHVIDDEQVVPLQSFLILLVSTIAGAFLAIEILPALLPGILATAGGEAPKAYWYLSRSSAFAAYLLLWLSMSFGLIITNRMAQLWPGGPAAFDLHQHVSLLGIAFSFFHALILLGDQYISPSLANLLVPFGLASYRPVWVGLGQLSIYLSLLVTLTFYARKRLGNRRWRTIHLFSYVAFLAVMLHGIFGGTDTSTVWAVGIYFTTGISVVFLTLYRMLVVRMPQPSSRSERPVPRRA